MKTIITILTIYSTFIGFASGQQVYFSPFTDWHINQSVHEIAVGEDIIGTHTTADDHMRMSVQLGAETFYNQMNNQWKVNVHREDRDWDNGLKLYVRRTGEGSGPRYDNPISGGTVFKKVNKSPKTFFTCKGWRFDIPIQFEIRGVSLILEAKTYSTGLVFTIIDN